VAPWITVLSQHTPFTVRGDLHIYAGVLFRETSHHAQANVTSGALCTVPFLWLRDEHRRQRSLADDFAGQCWLWWRSSRITFVPPVLFLGVGRSWLFLASSVKFLTRRSLKSRLVYLAPYEDNRIQLLSTVRSRMWKKQFHGPLEATSTHRIAVGHTIRIVGVPHVLVLLFHDVRFNGAPLCDGAQLQKPNITKM